jgi:hypothetical protein
MFRNTISSIASGGRAKEHAALVAEHTRDERESEAQALKIRRDIERDDERCAQLRASLDETAAHRYRLQLEVSQLSQAHDRRRSERERQILALADPRIDEFVTSLERQRELLHSQIVKYDIRGARDSRTGERVTSQGSNLAAVQHMANAIGQARLQAEALKRQHVPDVAAALEAIRRAIPTVDQAEQMLRDKQEVA